MYCLYPITKMFSIGSWQSLNEILFLCCCSVNYNHMDVVSADGKSEGFTSQTRNSLLWWQSARADKALGKRPFHSDDLTPDFTGDISVSRL